MSEILNPIRRASNFLHQSAAPVDLGGARPTTSLLSRKIGDVENLVLHGPPFTLQDLPAYLDAVKNLNGAGLDDRLLLLEKILVVLSRLPEDSAFAGRLEKRLITLLYKDLPHPPSAYLAAPRRLLDNGSIYPQKNPTYAFRSADASGYNVLDPFMGMAGSTYARSVPSTNSRPHSFLPEPALIFDTLLKREQFVPQPGGISSLFFAFANIIVHSIFDTNHADWTINNASSYLDLSPLYGSTQRQVDAIRRKDGTGRLWDDVFADARLLLMPPSVCALLIIFSRNHNYVANRIFDINERGSYLPPANLDNAARLAQDEEIFQRSRLVNCGYFMQIVLGDYVGAILGLVRDGCSWRLDPLETIRDLDHEFVPQGQGNVVSIEFNLLYRWHAALSSQDTAWTERLFKDVFHGKDFNTITVEDFKAAVSERMHSLPDVKAWTFANLQRGADNRFDSAELAKILQDATEASASAFGARGIPDVLRVIEIMGIEQARSWGACSLNEFRKFMGLKPYATFEEWNPDPAIHTAAEMLYHHIENLELHVGLQAEEAKKPTPGAGLCPGYTISRAILADAVCLTRGDRFLTVDFTPFNLTTWGYQDCQLDKSDGSFGGILSKLLFRILPEYYPAGSAYAHFPFMVPTTMKEYLGKLPDSPVDKYIWTRPSNKMNGLAADKFTSANMGTTRNSERPGMSFEARLMRITKGINEDRSVINKVIFNDVAVKKWADSFSRITHELINSKSVARVGSEVKCVDIVRDVINLVPVHWIANEIVGLPMKTVSNPRGEYREHALYDMFADAAEYLYMDPAPDQEFSLRQRATGTADKIHDYVKGHFSKISAGFLSASGLTDSVIRFFAGQNDHSNAVLRSLLSAGQRAGCSDDRLIAGLLAEVVATAPLYSKIVAEVVDYYLRNGNVEMLSSLASRQSSDVQSILLQTIREGLQSVTGQVVQRGLLTPSFLEATAAQVIGAIFRLRDLQRVPGRSGELKNFFDNAYGSPVQLYPGPNGHLSTWPTSMVVQYRG